MVQRITAAALVAAFGLTAVAESADFNALTPGTIYPIGSQFTDGGLNFDVLAGISGARVTAAGATPVNPAFNGNFLNLPSNVEVAINLPTGASQIQFDFVRGYTSGGLRINGGMIAYTQIPGTINGVTVTNLLGSKTNPWGSITATGSIESFAIIGTEFWVDNLVATLSTELAGDYNDNQIVDGADYVTWRNNANNPSGYNSWRANFGATSGAGSGAAPAGAVPELPTLSIIGALLTWIFSSARHRGC